MADVSTTQIDTDRDLASRKKLESLLLAAGLLWGGSAGVGLGVWLVEVKQQPPLADGPLAAAQAASPYVVLIVALAFAIDRILLATANAAVSDKELVQAEAYAMIRAVVPSASAALTAGYLTAVVALEQSKLVLVGVAVLGFVGVAIAWVSRGIALRQRNRRLPTRTWGRIVLGVVLLSFPLVVAAWVAAQAV